MSRWATCFESRTTYLMPGGHFGVTAANEGRKQRRAIDLLYITEGPHPTEVPSHKMLREEANALAEQRATQPLPEMGLDAAAVMKAFRTNGPQAVIDVFTNALQNAEQVDKPDLLQRRAIAYLALGSPGLALSDAEGAIEASSAYLPSRLLASRIHTMFGGYEEALRHLDLALSIKPGDAKLLTQQKKLRKYSASVREMESLVRSQVFSYPPVAPKKPQIQQTEEVLLDTPTESPKQNTTKPPDKRIGARQAVHGMRGTSIQLQTARQKAEILLELSPHCTALAHFKARCSLALGENERAAADAATAIKVGDNGQAPYGLALLATALHNMDEEKRVGSVLKQCFRLDPENKGHCQAMKQYTRKLNRALKDAAFFTKAGEGDNAMAALREGIELEPPQKLKKRLWGDMCKLALKQLNGMGAVEACSELLGFDPTNPDYLLLRGKAHEMTGNMPAAILDYEQAQNLGLKDPKLKRRLRDAKVAAKKSKCARYYELFGLPPPDLDNEEEEEQDFDPKFLKR